MSNYDNWKTSLPEEKVVTCRCGDEGVPGEGCPSCGEYLLDDDDITDLKTDETWDRMREGY